MQFLAYFTSNFYPKP